MVLVYRKHTNPLDLEWHFHIQCPCWPEKDFYQVQFVHPSDGERLCEDCMELESEIETDGLPNGSV